MKRIKILSVLFLLPMMMGCGSPTAPIPEEEAVENHQISSSGNMVVGNILVAALWQKLYIKNEKEKDSTLKRRNDSFKNPAKINSKEAINIQ